MEGVGIQGGGGGRDGRVGNHVFLPCSFLSPSPLSLSSLSTKNTEREKRAADHHHDAVRAPAHAASRPLSVLPLRRRPVLPCAERGSFGGATAVNLSQVMQTRHRAHESHARGGNSVRSGEETSDGGGIRRRCLSRPPQRSH